MFFLFNAFAFENDSDLADKVKQASSDERAFEALSKEFAKHNRFIASRATGRFISESDDEWSVVLLAFYEAVKKYSPDKGAFIAFSDMVIKRRLIDSMRTQTRTAAEIPADLSGDVYDTDDGSRYDPAARAIAAESEASARRDEESNDLREEIGRLDTALKKYGIAFADLPAASPKADKTKSACARAAMMIASADELSANMKRSGRLPAKELSEKLGIPLKLLDRHRKYIIAAAEIMTGDYPGLQQFMQSIRETAAAYRK